MIKKYIKWLITNFKIIIKGNYFVLIGTPTHGNIGDQAIALSEYQFLHDLDEKKEILEIPSELVENIRFFKPYVGNRIVLIHGGGFIGTLYLREEMMLRNVIEAFPKNKIIILPQTITFSDDELGAITLEESKRIYSKHRNLFICAREKASYHFAKEEFSKNNVLLIPDMVLQMKYKQEKVNKNGALLCLRSDKEKNLTDENIGFIENIVSKYFSNEYKHTDTFETPHIGKRERKSAVYAKIEEFSNAKLVITDRLHGMVLAAFAETPCIALGNTNGKVKGIYEWISNNDYIKYVDNIDEIEEVVKNLLSIGSCEFQRENILKEYDQLKTLIVG